MSASTVTVPTFQSLALRHGKWLASIAVRGGEFEAPTDPTSATGEDLVDMTRAASAFLDELSADSLVIDHEDSVDMLNAAAACLTAAQDVDGDARSALLRRADEALKWVEDLAEELALEAD
ncbi:hypothetical protein ACFV1L_21025 [Kitasatospora sp. NPDC059646]|uniref:hypothetical protein n=1 Tax=Kitasatospora sp. NPDC059646 TaxID=3346893 RepID=UPI0036C2192C